VTAFVDSSVWFASVFAKDRYNKQAKEILRSKEAFVTTDAVVVETWLLLARRFHYAAADRFWGGIRRSTVAVEPVLPPDYDTAWEIGVAFPDQSFSIVDRTSFAVMQRLGLNRVASFDDDFTIYRYGHDRDRAFEVLR
jgi:predicted nucleic acid-binding protein